MVMQYVMKKCRVILLGAFSLIVFGLLLPQPIQAILVLVDSPLKEFFTAHAVLLCVVVGFIQGLFEEGGYYFVLKRILRKENTKQAPILFGLGRSGLHTIFDLATIFSAHMSPLVLSISLLARFFGFGALMGLTMIDYESITKGRMRYLIFSISLHAIINGILYSAELNLFQVNDNFDSIFMICFSCVVMVVTALIYKNRLKKRIKPLFLH